MASTENPHVWEYLTYYLSLPHSPHYAVLISGPWGIGKTYLVKEFLRQNAHKTKKHVYMSLYGLSSIEEIDNALFQAAFPLLGGKLAKITGRLAKAGLKYVGVDSGDLSIRDVMTKLNADLYIFDDLERCEAPLNQVLGYINQFVEHDGVKVIILANEKEIGSAKKKEDDSDGDYKRRREKLIGKTLEVRSAFDDAFAHFASKIDDVKTRQFFEKNAGEISIIYAQSELNNLRILQQTMWDFERFCGVLKPAHRKNSEAMLALLRLLFALSFELKAARINIDDLTSGRSVAAVVSAHLAKTKTPLMTVGARYPLVDLNDTILSNEVLADYLIRGIVDARQIQTCLDASRFFVKVADEAPWRTVWLWMERTEKEFDAAFKKMEAQFSTREFTVQGEILHVLGLRLTLSDMGVLNVSRAQLVLDGKKYIDDVYKRKTLELPPPGDFDEIRFNGFGGLGIHHETPEYKELFAYLRSATQRAIEDTYPKKAINLLKEMGADVHLFYRYLCLTNDSDNIYYRTPILASLDPDAFAVSSMRTALGRFLRTKDL
jgi:DNA polymerase III delta prime subunit